MTYKEILDAQWDIDKAIIPAQRQYDEYYKQYGKYDKKDLLTELAYNDLKLLREARKTFKKMVKLMSGADLYRYSV